MKQEISSPFRTDTFSFALTNIISMCSELSSLPRITQVSSSPGP